MRRNSLVVVSVLLLVLMVWTVNAFAVAQTFATFKQGGIHNGQCNFPNEFKQLYIYGLTINEFYTAVEFQLVLPPCLLPVGYTPGPGTSLVGGNPWTGVQQAFHPPLNGFFPGLDLWGTVSAICTGSCDDCGYDQPVLLIGHPVSGLLQGTRDDPLRTKFPIVGLTTILCPAAIGVEETTWGKVKALYQENQ